MSTQNKIKNAGDMSPKSTLFPMITGFWISQAIYAAAKFGIADLLKDGPKSSAELAESAGVSPRELFRLLRFLAGVNVFSEDEEGRFVLTPLAEGLQSDVPGSLRAMAIMYGEEIYRAWGDVLHSIRTGETAFDHVYGSGHFAYLAQHPEAAAVFDQAMTGFTARESAAVIAAYDFARFDEVVDIGGGQGSFIAAVLSANPKPKAVLFELPQVIDGAKRKIEAAGLADRCQVVGGDFFRSVPGGRDVYVLKNIILNWDDERSVAILKNCRRAMAVNGRLLVIEAVIPPGNVPSLSKLLDLHMLVVTGGRGRNEQEFRALFAAAGLKLTSVIPTQSATSVIEGVCAST